MFKLISVNLELKSYIIEKLSEDLYECNYQIQALENWLEDKVISEEAYLERKSDLEAKKIILESHLDKIQKLEKIKK